MNLIFFTFQNNKLNLLKSKKIIIITFIFICFWTFPGFLTPVHPSIDGSWQIGRSLWLTENHPIPDTLTWTFGPLGYLTDKLNIDQSHWTQSVFYQLLVHFGLFLILSIFFIKNKISAIHSIPIAVILVLMNQTGIWVYLPIFILILSYYLYIKFGKSFLFLIPLPIFSSFLLFIKFDLAVGSIALILVSSCILLYKKRWIDVLALSISYTISVIVIGSSFGLPISQILSYIQGGLAISSGFTAAMSLELFDILLVPWGTEILLFSGILSWSIFIAIMIHEKYRKSNPEFVILSVIPLFIFFKLGLVRDDHFPTFFLAWAFLVYLYLISSQKTIQLPSIRFVGYLLVAFLVLSAITTFEVSKKGFDHLGISSLDFLFSVFTTTHIESFPSVLQFLSSENSYDDIRIAEKNNLKNHYLLSNNTLDTIGNDTIEIFPWEIALLYAYDLNWNPYSLSQPYSSYTAELDQINSNHLNIKEISPEFILISSDSIDGRYYLFDEPLTLRNILCNYNSVTIDQKYLLLQKEDKNCSSPHLKTSMMKKINETIEIPKHNSDYLFANVKIEYSILGKISEIFFKPPQIHVLIDNQTSWRFIHKTAQNGILISTSDNAKQGFPLLMNDIHSLKFITNPFFYNENIDIEFYEMNSTKNNPIKIKPLEILSYVYNSRPDLQNAYPNAANGNYSELIEWAKIYGVNESWQIRYITPYL